ncbi:MAG: hypothetical protein KME54_11035 [Tolypothrix brevis GSE-NOS-MK-07-07A]|nr:hypothetical protein [Tolypothrix brevis GSE-NOS-MK-07-07A]
MAHLKDFSLVSPDIQSSDVLKAIEIAIPAFAIEQAIANIMSGSLPIIPRTLAKVFCGIIKSLAICD